MVQPMHDEFLMLMVSGLAGFLDFGDVGTHIVGYQTPLPVVNSAPVATEARSPSHRPGKPLPDR
jgi:hypothetical protein